MVGEPLPIYNARDVTHSMVWFDDGLVGYKCSVDPLLDQTLDAEDGPRTCEGCGKLLKLVWLAQIVEG